MIVKEVSISDVHEVTCGDMAVGEFRFIGDVFADAVLVKDATPLLQERVDGFISAYNDLVREVHAVAQVDPKADVSVTPCCGYAVMSGDTGPIFWNRFNACVQCHACGARFLASKG